MYLTEKITMASISYTIFITLKEDAIIRIGQLGTFMFPKGDYAYTGSARKNIQRRIARHYRRERKKLRWHIDFLLNHHAVRIIRVEISDLEECVLNQSINGEIIIPGFGASDCKYHCRSHLKRLINAL